MKKDFPLYDPHYCHAIGNNLVLLYAGNKKFYLIPHYFFLLFSILSWYDWNQ